MAGVCVLLLFVIAALSSAVRAAGKIFWERERQKKASLKNTSALLLLLAAMALPRELFAQSETAVAQAPQTFPVALYALLLLAALELIIIGALTKMLLRFLSVPGNAKQQTNKAPVWGQWLQKIVPPPAPPEQEAALDLNHDYDGIRELDNKIPAWWKYAFIATILFGFVYMYRMFVSGSLPDQFQELEHSKTLAAIQKEAYLKNAANNVDEHTVTMVDQSGLAEGALLYSKNCAACHGDMGQGGVGPNLTDDYWLHKGGLKDIFYSIKYGWPEKGMKSWSEDFSPVQIARIASYVASLHGTNPPGGKEPQGTVYVAEETEATAAAPQEHENDK